MVVAPLGDAIASRIARATVILTPPRNDFDPPQRDDADAEARTSPRFAAVMPRRVASERERARRHESVETASPSRAAADGEHGTSASEVVGATIVVPSAVVTRAIQRRDISAVDAKAPDGSPLGARLRGVSAYGVGLRDGDVVISVAGTRTPTVAAMVAAGLSAANGATRLTGKIQRGTAVHTVVLELPAH
jgi:hypothetical protein